MRSQVRITRKAEAEWRRKARARLARKAAESAVLFPKHPHPKGSGKKKR